MKQDIEIFNTGDIYKDMRAIIEQTRNHAYQAVNTAMLQRNWLLGKRIADEEMQGENRAEYGKEIITRLAEHLTNSYGKGYAKSNLYQFVQFYKFFPNIFHTVSGKSQKYFRKGDDYMKLLKSIISSMNLRKNHKFMFTKPISGV